MKRLPLSAGSTALAGLAALALAAPALATHNTPHTTPCAQAENVGGGTLGNSPSPLPKDISTARGWDVGGGQCNGSFTVVRDTGFPGGRIELGMRAEQRRVGQIAPVAPGEYVVQTGSDTQLPPAPTRAWWNFQQSIAYAGDISTLDSLTFTIRTDYGTSVPTGPADMLALRSTIDARNSKPNPTPEYADHYQTSQNPVFGWFSSYNMANEGAWTLTLTAVKGSSRASVSVCIRTPFATCVKDVQIDLNPGSTNRKINTASKSLVSIAILGEAGFDPISAVDRDSVRVRTAVARTTSVDDTNGDGFDDLVLRFRSRDMDPPTPAECSDPNATILLTGSLEAGGAPFQGTDLVTWLGPACE